MNCSKNHMSYYYKPIKMAKIITPNADEDLETVNHSYIAAENVKRYTHLKTSWSLLKLKMDLPYN